MRKVVLAAMLWAVCIPVMAADDDLSQAIAVDYENLLEDLFIHFHSHPELSFREYETSARVAKELRAAGIVVAKAMTVAVLELLGLSDLSALYWFS